MVMVMVMVIVMVMAMVMVIRDGDCAYQKSGLGTTINGRERLDGLIRVRLRLSTKAIAFKKSSNDTGDGNAVGKHLHIHIDNDKKCHPHPHPHPHPHLPIIRLKVGVVSLTDSIRGRVGSGGLAVLLCVASPSHREWNLHPNISTMSTNSMKTQDELDRRFLMNQTRRRK